VKLFDKSKTPQRNSNLDKDVTLFVIKSDKSDFFFLQPNLKMEEQGRKLSKEEVEKFYIVLKEFLIFDLKYHYIL